MAESSMGDPAAEDSMEWTVNHIEQASERAAAYYALYTYFCEQVIQDLVDE